MIRLTALLPRDIQAAAELYHASFPIEEQRPWTQITTRDKKLKLLGIYYDDTFCGLLTLWLFDEFAYIEHFAIDPARRGQGIGAETIEALKSDMHLPLVLEVEPPGHTDPMAARRIDFYRRCGFVILDYDYIQPPYSPGLPSVPLLLMSTSALLSPALIERTLHSEVYGLI